MFRYSNFAIVGTCGNCYKYKLSIDSAVVRDVHLGDSCSHSPDSEAETDGVHGQSSCSIRLVAALKLLVPERLQAVPCGLCSHAVLLKSMWGEKSDPT